MNKTVAFIGLGAAVCMTAPAFAQDTHLSLTKESVAVSYTHLTLPTKLEV